VAATKQPWVFQLTGGHLSLDFANTVSWRRSGRQIERLQRYDDLVAWGRQARTVTDTEAQRLRSEARRRPADAGRALVDAVALREVIYRIFAGLAHGRRPAAADVAALNARLCQALSHLTVAARDNRFAWTWSGPRDDLGRAVWPAVRSAAELLTSDDLGDLRTCGAENCGWVFLDTTRNHSRRWCDMRVCGNRAKVRRYNARRREA
jgi:predicted RNA-binding Zn ribbon-like protein